MGYAAHDSLPTIYGSAGALVLPSLFDEWGLVVNEAMASGLPVLGSRYSQAVEEMVTDGRTGWCFDPLRPATVADALDKIFSASDRGSHGDAPGSAGALSNDNLRGGGREHARSDSCCLMCRHADLIAFEHGSNTCLPPGRKISICAHHPL